MSKSNNPDQPDSSGKNIRLQNSKEVSGREVLKKRRRRRRSVKPVEEVERKSEEKMDPVLFRALWLGALIVVIVGIAATAYGIWGGVPDPEPRELSAKEKEDRKIKKIKSDYRALVKAYFAATTVDEKLKYVRQPERVEPLMRDWYEKQKHPMVAKEVPAQMSFLPQTLFAKSFLKAEMNEGGMFMKQLWIQRYEDGLFAIDWETDVVYNPIDWDTFLAKKSTSPFTLRVYVGWDNLYLYQHRDEEKFQCFKLESRDSDQVTSAYMDRADVGMQTMMFFIRRSAKNPNYLSKSATLPFLVTLKYDESPEGKKNLVIEKLVSPSWIVFEKDVVK